MFTYSHWFAYIDSAGWNLFFWVIVCTSVDWFKSTTKRSGCLFLEKGFLAFQFLTHAQGPKRCIWHHMPLWHQALVSIIVVFIHPLETGNLHESRLLDMFPSSRRNLTLPSVQRPGSCKGDFSGPERFDECHATTGSHVHVDLTGDCSGQSILWWSRVAPQMSCRFFELIPYTDVIFVMYHTTP